MTDKTEATNFILDLPEPVDVAAIERRARELRAQAFADALRAAVSFALRRRTTTRPAGRSLTA